MKTEIINKHRFTLISLWICGHLSCSNCPLLPQNSIMWVITIFKPSVHMQFHPYYLNHIWNGENPLCLIRMTKHFFCEIEFKIVSTHCIIVRNKKFVRALKIESVHSQHYISVHCGSLKSYWWSDDLPYIVDLTSHNCFIKFFFNKNLHNVVCYHKILKVL